jgi:excisionase family DNA binding protein
MTEEYRMPLLTISEAARRCGVDRRTLQRAIARGRLPRTATGQLTLDALLAQWDDATSARLYDQARATLVAEGVAPWHLIRPVIEARMVDLWEGQAPAGGGVAQEDIAA